MMANYLETQGKLVRLGTDELICATMLDLIAEKPFHKIKVKEIVERASISRSTFYAYFDSIYEVVQRIEDDFLEGFYPETIAMSVLLDNDADKTFEQIGYIREKRLVIQRLCGPNGDPYFLHRIENLIKDLSFKALEKKGSDLHGSEREFLVSYIAGGTISTIRATAEHEGELPAEKIHNVNAAIMAANNILLNPERHRADNA